MKEFTFRAWCSAGGDTYVCYELTDEEAERLLKFGTDPNVISFSRCGELADIYSKVYMAAVEQITEEMREWGSEDEDENEAMQDPAWSAETWYNIGVGFPKEFYDLR
jgi:hypothetical protein